MVEEENLTKLYYSIGDVAQMFDVNTSLIRFWEKEFPSTIRPKKNKKGNRQFTPKDILEIKKIYQHVKIEGRTLEGVKKLLKSKSNDETFVSQKDNVLNHLENIKNKLLELKSNFS